MNQPTNVLPTPRRPRRRRWMPALLLSTGLLATTGAGVWHLAGRTSDDSAADASSAQQLGQLDALANSWANDAPAQAAAPGETAAGDPFLNHSTPPTANYPVQQAAASARGKGRYAQAAPVALESVAIEPVAPESVARGQSPGESSSRLSVSTEPSVGNPLRGGGAASQYDQPDAEEARKAFGEVLAAEAPEGDQPALLRVASGNSATSQPQEIPAAFQGEAPLASTAAAPESTPSSTPPNPFAGSPLPGAELTPPAPLGAESPAAIEPIDSTNQPPAAFAAQPLAGEPTANEPVQTESPASESMASPPTRPGELRSAPTAFAPAPQPLEPTSPTVSPAAPAPLSMPAASRPILGSPTLSSPALGSPGQPEPAYDFSQNSAEEPLAVTPPGAGRPGERAMEGRQQPSLAIQKFAPQEIQVGKPCKFIIKVRNVGQRPAVGVMVRDQTPSGTRLMATTPRAKTSGDLIAWDLGTMSPGEERALEMELTPIEEGEIGSVATVSFAAHASAKTRCTRPQLAIRMTAPKRVLVGRQQKVTIEMHNPGTGDATGVMLLENVPENLRHAAGAALEFEVGTLRAGETRTMELVMGAEKAGHVVNVLTARADGNIEVQQKVEFDVVAPELAVSVDGPKRRYLERPATYTVGVTNPGTAAAKDLRLVTRLPQGMRFVKANNLGEYDASTHAVYWSLAELPEGERGEVKLTALPVTPGDLKLKVEGQAREGLKDVVEVPIKVEGIAALKFEVLDVEDPIEVGGETVYEIRVANQGTKAATNVEVRVVTPAGMQAVAASGESRHTVQAGAVSFAPLERLAPQAEAMFRVRIKGVQPGDHRLTVEVNSDDLAQPVRKEESTRVFGDE